MYILVVVKGRARAPETTGRRWNRVRGNHMVCHLENTRDPVIITCSQCTIIHRISKHMKRPRRALSNPLQIIEIQFPGSLWQGEHGAT